MIRSPLSPSSLAFTPTGIVAFKSTWPNGSPVTTGTRNDDSRSFTTSAPDWRYSPPVLFHGVVAFPVHANGHTRDLLQYSRVQQLCQHPVQAEWLLADILKK